MKLVLATHNPGKVIEMRNLLVDTGLEVLSADEVGHHTPADETGTTLTENALIKARDLAEKIDEWVLSEDTGLFVDALGGEPGINSARWAGNQATDEEIRDYLLRKMKNIRLTKRTAQFKNVVAVISPRGEEFLFEGIVKGVIAEQSCGKSRPHLPYDQVFIPRNMDKTFSQLTDKEKNMISHRRMAFEKVKQFFVERNE